MGRWPGRRLIGLDGDRVLCNAVLASHLRYDNATGVLHRAMAAVRNAGTALRIRAEPEVASGRGRF